MVITSRLVWTKGCFLKTRRITLWFVSELLRMMSAWKMMIWTSRIALDSVRFIYLFGERSSLSVSELDSFFVRLIRVRKADIMAVIIDQSHANGGFGG